MANDKPDTDFGDGGVGSTKQDYVGMDNGIVSDEQKIPDENPTLMEDNGSLRRHDSGQTREGEPDAGEGTSTTLTEEIRHTGGSASETSS